MVVGHFGSGWVWLGLRNDGGAEIAETHDGVSLISTRPDLVPLLVIGEDLGLRV